MSKKDMTILHAVLSYLIMALRADHPVDQKMYAEQAMKALGEMEL